jgi:hypothetical protein
MKNEKINKIAAAIAAAIGSEGGVTAEKCAEIARAEVEKIIPTIAGMIQESAGVRRVEVVTADAPALEDGSEIEVYPDDGSWTCVVHDGKVDYCPEESEAVAQQPTEVRQLFDQPESYEDYLLTHTAQQTD